MTTTTKQRRPLTVYKASAGSGKTFTLAVEYISLLVSDPENYRHILAVTFTNKATQEMKLRILSQLYGIANSLPGSDTYMEKVMEQTGLGAMAVRTNARQALSLLTHHYNFFRVQTIDAFFQGVLRNLAHELDLTANLESTADATGALHTDYTFKFSKRILNNRLRISMGGRVSTGATAADDNGAYFDNFSLEYRLNQKETQYLKLYYEREAYDWLEGNISVFGGGFSWRRKLRHFKDIFKLKSDDDAVTPVIRTDSTQRKLP